MFGVKHLLIENEDKEHYDDVQVVLKMLGAEHLLLPPEQRSASWRNSDYTEVYRWTMMVIVVVVKIIW